MTYQQTSRDPGRVTTGPVTGSAKAYSSPACRPDILVPHRLIALDPSATEPPVRVYDTSGPYTDPAVTIDLAASTSRRAIQPARGAAGG